MIRTTLLLPETLHQRLLLAARNEDTSVSRLVRNLLDTALARREKKRIDHMYNILKKLDGIGEKDITDASETIDEVLYGQKGAWRGSGQ